MAFDNPDPDTYINPDPDVAPPLPEPTAADIQGFMPAAKETLKAFGRGFSEGWGPDALGSSKEDAQKLAEWGIYEKGQHYTSPFKAFNELAIEAVVRTGQVGMRTLTGAFRGTQAAITEAGEQVGQKSLARDIAALPEAFFGSPHPTGMFKVPRLNRPVTADLPRARDLEVIGDTRPSISEGTPADAARNSGPGLVSYIENFAQEPITPVARTESDFRVQAPKFSFKPLAESDPRLVNISENFESLRTEASKTYPSLSKQFDEISASFKGAANVDVESIIERIDTAVSTIERNSARSSLTERLSRFVEDLGSLIDEPLVQQSIYQNNLRSYYKYYMDTFHELTRENPGWENHTSVEQMLKSIEQPYEESLPSGRKTADELFKYAERSAFEDAAVVLRSRLKVIHADEPPRSMPLTAKGDVIKSEPTGNPWRDRFDEWVSRLKTTDDFKDLITKAADANGEFQLARRGEVPAAHVAGVADAAGINPASINASKLGRLMKRDEEIILTRKALFKLNDDVHAAMREVSAAPNDPATLIKLTEAMIRRDTGLEGALEQAVGLRAEWGRAGNALKTLLEEVKDTSQLGDFLRKNKNEKLTVDDLRRLATEGAKLDPRTQLPNFLTSTRSPTFWDKFLWYWTNSLISGPFTHTKYIGANAVYAGWESGVVTPVAGMVGRMRESFSGPELERVYMGEAAARTWGYVAGTPDAIKASWQALKSGAMTQLPHEITTNSPINIFTGVKPVTGIPAKLFGWPAHGASGIHTFFRFLGYTAELEAQAYRATAKEGLSPMTEAFWQRYGDKRAFPEDAWMDKAIENGNKLTFITELGEKGKAFQNLTTKVPPAKLLVPFAHIPINIMKATYENTPFGLLDKDIRATLKGENGEVARDMQIARTIAGSAVSAYIVNLALNDRITGAGPADRNDRASWMLTHQPYSVRIGDTWYSFQRFGPIGNLIGLAANLAEVGPHIHEGEYAKGAWGVTHSAGHLLMEETGFQGIYLFIKALESEQRGASYVSNFMASMLPYSSFFGQTAGAMDPYMRETKTFLEGLKYKIPVARETLFPKRDWTGQPIANNAEGWAAIIKQRAVNEDPVDIEMQTLKLHVAPPQDRIGGVKLTQALYDEYQTLAGVMTRTALQHLVENPNWFNLPLIVRENTFKSQIEGSRKAAAGIMQMKHPELIQEGIENKVDHIKGTPRLTPAQTQQKLEKRLAQ